MNTIFERASILYIYKTMNHYYVKLNEVDSPLYRVFLFRAKSI